MRGAFEQASHHPRYRAPVSLDLSFQQLAEAIVLFERPDQREASDALKRLKIACINTLDTRVQSHREGQVLEISYAVCDPYW